MKVWVSQICQREEPKQLKVSEHEGYLKRKKS